MVLEVGGSGVFRRVVADSEKKALPTAHCSTMAIPNRRERKYREREREREILKGFIDCDSHVWGFGWVCLAGKTRKRRRRSDQSERASTLKSDLSPPRFSSEGARRLCFFLQITFYSHIR